MPEFILYCVSVMPCSTARVMLGPVTSRPCGSPARDDRIPQLDAALRAERVDLEPRLLAPAGVRDDARHAGDVHRGAVEAAQRREVAVVERLEDGRGERALELQRRDVGLLDLDLRAAREREAVGPQRDVAIRVRVPDRVLERPQDDAVGHHLAARIADRREAAAADREVEHVARAEVVREAQRVRPAQLRLALGADVPERHALRHRRVLDRGIAPVVDRACRCGCRP